MSSYYSFSLASILAVVLATPGFAQEATAPLAETAAEQQGVISYTPADFAAARPNTALDMINRLPGFAFDGGDSVRGFAGAAGNVLIDGQRPDHQDGLARRHAEPHYHRPGRADRRDPRFGARHRHAGADRRRQRHPEEGRHIPAGVDRSALPCSPRRARRSPAGTIRRHAGWASISSICRRAAAYRWMTRSARAGAPRSMRRPAISTSTKPHAPRVTACPTPFAATTKARSSAARCR